MKYILILIALGAAGILLALFMMGMLSKSGNAPGLVEGKLSVCPSSPNCICTEYPEDVEHYIKPVEYGSANIKVVRSLIRKSIDATGGTMVREKDNYFAATYHSGVFGFVDDLEVRIDEATKQIHIRSASRVGYSDMGANMKRVRSLVKRLQS